MKKKFESLSFTLLESAKGIFRNINFYQTRMNKSFLTGFTLAEILIVCGLFAILITIGAGIFLSHNRFYENQAGEISSINSTREAADRINEYARAAIILVSSYTYNSVLYTSGSQIVIFGLPAIDSANNIIEGSFDYVIIGANPVHPNRMELIVDPNPSSARIARNLLLTDRLTSLTFTYDNQDFSQVRKISYEFRVTDIGRSPGTERVFGSSTLRNK